MGRALVGSIAVVVVAAVLLVGAGSASGSAAETLTGSGSTLVAPLLEAWNTDYSSKTGTSINFGAFGSSAGVAAITQRIVDFGATDAPLTPTQWQAAGAVVQIPWALSATALSYQITGVTGGLRLTPSVIADAYLGKLKYWDDAEIATLNPRLQLPHEQIQPVYRSDGSGDTF